MRLLLAEDDKPLADGLAHALTRAGHAVDVVHDGPDVLTATATTAFDALILDLGLPRLDGLAVLARLRADHRTSGLPVLVLTARDGLEARISGLDAGADDYLAKPFHSDEVLARLRAIARRREGRTTAATRVGPLSIDTAGRQVSLDGQLLALTPREYGVLEVLASRAGRVVSKTQLQDALADWSEDLSDTAIEIAISRLRKRLDGHAVRLRTLRGFGYVLDAARPDA